MSEHIWSQEQIASYFTGGLSLEERERLDRHAKECAECAAALAAAIHFDRGLGTLFMPLRPKPGLEDRAVQATRVAPKRHAILILGWPRRITAAAAAVILLGTFGALGISLLNDGRLPMPGEERLFSSRIRREVVAPDAAPAGGLESRTRPSTKSSSTTRPGRSTPSTSDSLITRRTFRIRRTAGTAGRTATPRSRSIPRGTSATAACWASEAVAAADSPATA
jgi:anti-sigma factor RsiW